FLFFFQLFGPSPPIVVSRRTTYITSPLRADGLPDYEKYVRETFRRDIAPNDNAAALLWRALGPGNLTPEQFRALTRELGLNEIPSADSTLQPLKEDDLVDRMLELFPSVEAGSAPLETHKLLSQVQKHPWVGGQLPPISAWVDANAAPLDLVVEASHRERFYSPSLTPLANPKDRLIGMTLPHRLGAREAARALAIRAMRRVGDKHLAEAWQDILAQHRLAQLVAQGPTVVEQDAAWVISNTACRETIALLSSEQLTKDLAQQIQHDLASLAPFANVADRTDQFERLLELDAVVNNDFELFAALQPDGKPPHLRANRGSIDRNLILEQLNTKYDAAVAAMRLPTFEARKAAFDQLLAQSPPVPTDDNIETSQMVAAFLSRNARSEMLGSFVTSSVLPSASVTSAAEDRTNTYLTLTKLAAALAVFQTEHGNYPEKLEERAPAVLDKLPVDLYHGKPYLYKRTNDGYLLYTAGENGIDDGGSSVQFSTYEGQDYENAPNNDAESLRSKVPGDADDLSIRIPVESLKTPKPKPP
ncbi:MAG TPA: hypothetical protein VHU84_18155, partial [Lacipirellulaceae bacterium]|nr:hypothetical protein [Lacipirellulaceae bacterium]